MSVPKQHPKISLLYQQHSFMDSQQYTMLQFLLSLKILLLVIFALKEDQPNCNVSVFGDSDYNGYFWFYTFHIPCNYLHHFEVDF